MSMPRTATGTSQGARREANANGVPGALTRSLGVIVLDVHECVIMFDDRGRVLYANPSATSQLSSGEPLDGKTLGDFLPPVVAAERLDHQRRVLASGRPLGVIGVLGGVLRRQVLRCWQDPDSGARGVVSVCCPHSEVEDVLPHQQSIEFVRAEADDWGPLAPLTERERDVLALIGEGMSTAEIAKRFHRSVKTIEWHRVSLGDKLGVSNRVELAHIAIRAGLARLRPRSPENGASAGIGTPAEGLASA